MDADLFTCEQVERRERRYLVPYAALSAETRGRVYPQAQHQLRTAFQRDRDRIVHSAAFRRMEYKTQVFIPHEKDHFRTRLTHTLEVAQIGRTMARSLRLNEDLTEAVALVHDLGHTPFGHAGEDVLNDLLADQGGFNHNWQSLRVVDLLEQRYPEHPGLNLSYEVREGIVRHETSTAIELPEFTQFKQPTLEATLVDIADEIAYNAHDIDDGLSSRLLGLEQLAAADFYQPLVADRTDLLASLSDDHHRYTLVRLIIERLASDVIAETLQRLQSNNVGSLGDVRDSQSKLAGYSVAMLPIVRDLKEFLWVQLYRHDKLIQMSHQARETIETIYERLCADPTLMPPRFQLMLVDYPTEIVISDYIAGMTDRYAQRFASAG